MSDRQMYQCACGRGLCDGVHVKRGSVAKTFRSTPQDTVKRRYSAAVAEVQRDKSWAVLAAPGGPPRHVLGRGPTEQEAWAAAAGRCMR